MAIEKAGTNGIMPGTFAARRCAAGVHPLSRRPIPIRVTSQAPQRVMGEQRGNESGGSGITHLDFGIWLGGGLASLDDAERPFTSHLLRSLQPHGSPVHRYTSLTG